MADEEQEALSDLLHAMETRWTASRAQIMTDVAAKVLCLPIDEGGRLARRSRQVRGRVQGAPGAERPDSWERHLGRRLDRFEAFLATTAAHYLIKAVGL